MPKRKTIKDVVPCCRDHPRYRGDRPPRSTCEYCRIIYVRLQHHAAHTMDRKATKLNFWALRRRQRANAYADKWGLGVRVWEIDMSRKGFD